MFHLAAYTASIDNTVNKDVAALSDDILNIQNGHFILQQSRQLLMAWVGSATLNRARLNSPTLRQVAPPFIRPINVGVIPTDDPNVQDFTDQSVTIGGQEEVILEATSDVAMSTEPFTGLLWLADRVQTAPAGNIITLRGTSTGTSVANAWTTIAVTWDQNYPAGTYSVVGAECVSTNIIAFRLIFDDQSMRPGHLGQASLANRSHPTAYNGMLGEWGRFRTISQPRLQVLVNGADTAFDLYLRAIRISA